MGVYIKGIDKPTSCHDCVFNYDWQECMAKIGTNDMLWDFTKYSPTMVYSSCPLEPVDDKQAEKMQRELVDDKQAEKMQRELVEAWRVFKV